jgi:hypothetical protein
MAHKATVVMVFNPSNGRVSINGGAWKHLRLMRGREEDVARPPSSPPPPDKKKTPAKDFPPPPEGDDRPQCLFCDDHQACMVHVWDGISWTCLGDECIGPFCGL